MSNLAARVLFAVVAIPVVAAAVYAGGIALAVLLAAAAGLAAWEFYRLAAAHGMLPLTGIGTALAVIVPLAVDGYRVGIFHPPVFALGAVVVLILLALAIFARGAGGHPIEAVSTTVFGVLYTGGMLAFAVGLRYQDYAVGAAAGTALVGLPLVLTWGTDTAAYFVGRALGRHKLLPSVSPGKTIEGAVGGLAASIALGAAYVHWVLAPVARLTMRPPAILVLAAVVSVAAQLGDLAESLIKREAGAKDSSRLIPGHGGVLDRLDALLFTLPVTYLALTFPHVLQPALR